MNFSFFSNLTRFDILIPTFLKASYRHNCLAVKRDMADLTPYFRASYEHDTTAPLVILSFVSSVIITACGFPFSVVSLSSSQDGKMN
jgi:hypothetical protein